MNKHIIPIKYSDTYYNFEIIIGAYIDVYSQTDTITFWKKS